MPPGLAGHGALTPGEPRRTLSGMATWRERLHQLTWATLAVAGLGLALLLTTAWIVFLTTPAGDLVAAFQAGEEPWTTIGLLLTLAGASGTVLLGTVGTLVRLDLVRAVLLIPPVVVAAGWWAAAVDLVRYPDFAGPDPVGFAFDFPIPAAVGLLLPAVAIAVLAMSADPERRPPVRMRPVHDEPREARDSDLAE
jgi:hypothetical protein